MVAVLSVFVFGEQQASLHMQPSVLGPCRTGLGRFKSGLDCNFKWDSRSVFSNAVPLQSQVQVHFPFFVTFESPLIILRP